MIDTFTTARERIITAVASVPAVGEGLIQQNVMARRDVINGEDYLIVEGQVANTVERSLELPRLKLALTDASGKEIIALTQQFSKTHLAPGDTIPFVVEFENPSGRARSMTFAFIQP